jgi:hypothetical protein
MAEIYDTLKAAGCQIDHHESDLYVKATPTALALTKGHPNRSFFISQIDRQRWIELPFMYAPWWRARAGRHGSRRIVRRTRGHGNATRGTHIPAHTAASLKAIGYDVWKSKPTIHSGHFDNLKYDDGKFRVWVSRGTVADFTDRRQYLRDRLTVEKLTNGRWTRA